MTMNKCKLCQRNIANQKNSHIIPKFFTKNLFSNSPHRHAFLLSTGGVKKKIQDTFKEDHILCDICERRIGILETYVSIRLSRLDDRKYFANHLPCRRGDFVYYKCPKINSKLAQLLFYSIMWRLKIYSGDAFSAVVMDADVKEKLRIILNKHTCSSQDELLENLDSAEIDLPYPFVLIRPKEFLNPPHSPVAAATVVTGVHYINLADYLLIFHEKKSTVRPEYHEIANSGEDLFKIGISSNANWTGFNEIIFQQIAKSMR